MCFNYFYIRQQNAAEKSTCGNGKKKVQHGSQKGMFCMLCMKYPSTGILPYVRGDGLFSAGHRVSGGERAAQTHSRRHRSVPLQRRRAQQDCHWRLPGRKVHAPKISSESVLLLLGHKVKFLYLLLAHRDDFNIKVLQAFVDLHEFTDLNLVQALR